MNASGARLGHVNIRAVSLEATAAWYERVLGLRRSVAATNPNMLENIWLLDETGSACVHVNQLVAGDVRAGNGYVDHIAFDMQERAAMEERLKVLEVPYTMISHPSAAIVQLNTRDPNGVKVELTFYNQP